MLHSKSMQLLISLNGTGQLLMTTNYCLAMYHSVHGVAIQNNIIGELLFDPTGQHRAGTQDKSLLDFF